MPANLLAHELEESSTQAPSTYNLEDYQEESATLGIAEMLPEWRAMAKEIPPLLVEA